VALFRRLSNRTFTSMAWPTFTGMTATGGTVTDIAGYRVHTFTSSGTFTITAGPGDVEYLVVGGGGGGGGYIGGGGGAGGFRTGTLTALTAGNYTVTVGAGGAASATTTNSQGNDGQDSVFFTITAVGGGGGGSAYGNAGRDGGSGGGGGSNRHRWRFGNIGAGQRRRRGR